MIRFHTIESGYFLGDGGAMFGPVPKKYWDRKYPADENNMCEMALRCLFIETDDRKILVDTGAGNKHFPKLRYYQPHKIKDLYEEMRVIGYDVTEVTDVILTHLHFDHCGGGTVFNKKQEAVPAFPNATYWVSLAQWKNYRNPNLFEKHSFYPENIEPIFNAGQLRFVVENMTLFDGLRLELYDGHTPGQIAVLFDTDDGNFAFPGDVVPTSLHRSLGWLSAYDTNLPLAMEEKKRFTEKARAQHRTLIFYHDAYTRMAKA